MGRYYWNKKDTVEDCRSVSISFLRKHYYFCGWRSGWIVWKNCYGEETSSISVAVPTMDDDKSAGQCAIVKQPLASIGVIFLQKEKRSCYR